MYSMKTQLVFILEVLANDGMGGQDNAQHLDNIRRCYKLNNR